jgi:hypothetical protein
MRLKVSLSSQGMKSSNTQPGCKCISSSLHGEIDTTNCFLASSSFRQVPVPAFKSKVNLYFAAAKQIAHTGKRPPSHLPSARLTLYSTKLCTKFKIFRKKIFFGTKVTSEAFLSISQNLKVTRLRGGKQTKLWTCGRNLDLSRSFERFSGLVQGFGVLQLMVWPKFAVGKNV